MIFKLHIHLDNAAFEEEPELSRILLELSDKVRGHDLQPCCYENLKDVNGNTVGRWAIKNEN